MNKTVETIETIAFIGLFVIIVRWMLTSKFGLIVLSILLAMWLMSSLGVVEQSKPKLGTISHEQYVQESYDRAFNSKMNPTYTGTPFSAPSGCLTVNGLTECSRVR